MRPRSKNFLGQFSLRKAGFYLLLFISILGIGLYIPYQAQAHPLMAANPSVSVIIPSPVMLGEDFIFTVTFENTGADTGYGPAPLRKVLMCWQQFGCMSHQSSRKEPVYINLLVKGITFLK